MKVELGLDDTLTVTFSEMGGVLSVNYGDELRVSIDTVDDKERTGVIYYETLETPEDERAAIGETDVVFVDNTEVIRTIECTEPDCGKHFDLTAGAIDFMKKTFGDKYRDPTRCPACRKRRKTFIRRKRAS